MVYVLRAYILFNFFAVIIGSASTDHLIVRSNCICPGYTLTIAECTVEGRPGGTMIWRGSAFDCSTNGNGISLSFSRFRSTGGECNNGSIQAQLIMGVEGNLFTSQLIITISLDMIGKTIECIHDNVDAISVVGALTLATVAPLPPPTTLFISKADFVSRQVTFNWNQADTKCPDLDIHYNILASNCGNCPIITNHTNVTCTNVITNSNACVLAIQTVICRNITGNESESIYVVSKNLDQPSQCTSTGAIASAAVFATFFMCGFLFTITLLVVLAKFKVCEALSHNNRKHQLDESSYETIKHNPEEISSGINTRKNIAYGQAHNISIT